MSSKERAAPVAETSPASQIRQLGDELRAEHGALERELAEIGLLLQQASTEAERHELRRAQAAERLDQLESHESPDRKELTEARQQLHQQTGRAALMSSQVQLLEGKQKSIGRFAERLRATVERLSVLETHPEEDADARPTSARAVMAAQEQMRREIARQMHDGPAQSIANIALQAEVVQRLMARDPAAAQTELADLGAMVQHALDATKSFIFDVRPMVLDDLGLVPTLRRSARERSQRTGVRIRFESVGADHRLEPELESNLFRIVDDAVTGFLHGPSEDIHVRLDWTDEALVATIRNQAEADPGSPTEEAPVERTAHDDVPDALAAMIEDQRDRARETAAARHRAFALPDPTASAIRARAASVGIDVWMEDEGRLLGVRVPVREQ